MPVNLTCQGCGEPFTVKPTKAATAKFCSVACRKARIALTCEFCGVEFETFRSRAHQQYCSPACQSRAKSGDLAQRFAADVDSSAGPLACWPHLRAGDTNGYGVLKFRDQSLKMHRLAYEFARGPIPAGMFVCHRCDNPRCCNPAHLFLGTASDNAADRHAKGRDARGESSGVRKLGERDVRLIRQMAGAKSAAAIAAEFGVSGHTIHCILHRKTWKHVA